MRKESLPAYRGRCRVGKKESLRAGRGRCCFIRKEKREGAVLAGRRTEMTSRGAPGRGGDVSEDPSGGGGRSPGEF